MNTPLRSGIFLAPFHAKADNPTLAMERDFELLQHLDRLNYSEAWIGEHHSGGVEIIAAPDMFIAAAAERTRHIRLGTGVSSLPYHNPLMVANRMIQQPAARTRDQVAGFFKGTELAEPGLVSVLNTPRIIMVSAAPCGAMMTSGIARSISLSCSAPERCNSSLDTVATTTGIFCTSSVRFSAVTTISSSPPELSTAGAAAAAVGGVCAKPDGACTNAIANATEPATTPRNAVDMNSPNANFWTIETISVVVVSSP